MAQVTQRSVSAHVEPMTGSSGADWGASGVLSTTSRAGKLAIAAHPGRQSHPSGRRQLHLVHPVVELRPATGSTGNRHGCQVGKRATERFWSMPEGGTTVLPGKLGAAIIRRHRRGANRAGIASVGRHRQSGRGPPVCRSPGLVRSATGEVSRLWIKCRIAGGDAYRPWKTSAFPPVGKVD